MTNVNVTVLIYTPVRSVLSHFGGEISFTTSSFTSWLTVIKLQNQHMNLSPPFNALHKQIPHSRK